MSEENVEIVLEFTRRVEASDIQGLREIVHNDPRVTAPEGWPEKGPFEGREAVIGQFTRLVADFNEQRIEIKRVVDEEDWVAVEFSWRVRGTASGIETQFDLAGAYRVEGSKVSEAHFRWKWPEALEAAGLSE